jgi:hypothetical protein
MPSRSLVEDTLADEMLHHSLQRLGVYRAGLRQLVDFGLSGSDVIGDSESDDDMNAPGRAEISEGPDVH